MKQPVLKSMLLGTLLATAGLVEAAEPGLYVGGGIGTASTNQSGYDNAGSYKLFVGAQAEGFGLELGYVDLGRFKQKGNSSNSYTVDGPQLNVIGELFISRGVYGYGSFGFYNWDLNDNLATNNDSGTSGTLGLGIKVLMGKNLAVRGGWDRYQNISDSNVDMLSLNGMYQF